MSQWGLHIVIDGATFLPHVSTDAFEPIGPSSLINDIIMTDNGGDPEKAKITHQRLYAQLVGKPYSGIRDALRTVDEMPKHIDTRSGARVPDLTDLERAKAISASLDRLTEADQAHRKVIQETYPIGTYVRWRERPYFKAGIVRGYSLTGHSLRVDETNGRHNKTVLMSAVLSAAMED